MFQLLMPQNKKLLSFKTVENKQTTTTHTHTQKLKSSQFHVMDSHLTKAGLLSYLNTAP